jgi:hypothetical protein
MPGLRTRINPESRRMLTVDADRCADLVASTAELLDRVADPRRHGRRPSRPHRRLTNRTFPRTTEERT